MTTAIATDPFGVARPSDVLGPTEQDQMRGEPGR